MTRHQPTITNIARDHLAELIELKAAIAHMLIEARHVASIHNAHVYAANTRAEFRPFINDSVIKADEPTTGIKPCK